jgi:hypothetical protein
MDNLFSNDLVTLYGSARRRVLHHICQPCISGNHSACPSFDCPCLCNDQDLRFPMKRVFGLGPHLFETSKLELPLTA